MFSPNAIVLLVLGGIFAILIGISLFFSLRNFSTVFSDRDGAIVFDTPVQSSNEFFSKGLVQNGTVPSEVLKPSVGATSYNFWLYVHDITNDPGNQKFIFAQQDPSTGHIDVRMSLLPDQNTLEIVNTTTFEGNNNHQEFFYVQDLPLQAWTMITYTKTPQSADVYVNGKLVRTCVFKGTATKSPSAAPSPIKFFEGGALTGFLSRFKILYRKMTVTEIEAAARAGPMNALEYNIHFQSPITIRKTIGGHAQRVTSGQEAVNAFYQSATNATI